MFSSSFNPLFSRPKSDGQIARKKKTIVFLICRFYIELAESRGHPFICCCFFNLCHTIVIIWIATCVCVNPPLEGHKKTCFSNILFSRKVTQNLKPLKDLEKIMRDTAFLSEQ